MSRAAPIALLTLTPVGRQLRYAQDGPTAACGSQRPTPRRQAADSRRLISTCPSLIRTSNDGCGDVAGPFTMLPSRRKVLAVLERLCVPRVLPRERLPGERTQEDRPEEEREAVLTRETPHGCVSPTTT